MRLELVVLDAMGVIYDQGENIDDDIVGLLLPFARERGCRLPAEEVFARYVDCSLGRYTTAEYWHGLGIQGPAGSDLDDAYLPNYRLMPGVLDFLAAMRSAALPVACLSNDTAEWAVKRRRLHRIEHLIEPWIISGEVGLRKADPAIFELLLSRVGLQAPQCLFVDDRAANVDAARSLGFHTVQFLSGGTPKGDHRCVSSFPELGAYILSGER